MGELSRRRHARDLWISRSHLWALGSSGVLLIVLSFAVGFAVAGGRADVPSAHAGGSADESLVDLLARVDNRVVSQEGVETLTYPDTLTGVAPNPAVPEPRAEAQPVSLVGPGAVDALPYQVLLSVDDVEAGERLVAWLAESGWASELSVHNGTPFVIVTQVVGLDRASSEAERLTRQLSEADLDLQPTVRPADP